MFLRELLQTYCTLGKGFGLITVHPHKWGVRVCHPSHQESIANYTLLDSWPRDCWWLTLEICRYDKRVNAFSKNLTPFKSKFLFPPFFLSFPLSLVAGWKLSPMVSAMYGPELYAGKALDMCCIIRHHLSSYCCVLFLCPQWVLRMQKKLHLQFPFYPNVFHHPKCVDIHACFRAIRLIKLTGSEATFCSHMDTLKVFITQKLFISKTQLWFSGCF